MLTLTAGVGVQVWIRAVPQDVPGEGFETEVVGRQAQGLGGEGQRAAHGARGCQPGQAAQEAQHAQGGVGGGAS